MYIKFSKEIRATASKGFMFLFICPNKRREAVSLGRSCSGSKTFELIFCVMFEFWCRPPLAWMYYVYFGRKLNVALRDDHFTVNQKLSNRQQSFRTTIHAPFPSSLQTKKNLVILRFYDRRLWFTFSVSKKRAIFSSKTSGHCVENSVNQREWNRENTFRQFYWWLDSVYRLLVRDSTRNLRISLQGYGESHCPPFYSFVFLIRTPI